MKKRTIDLQRFAEALVDNEGNNLMSVHTATYGKRLSETEAHPYFNKVLKDAIYEKYDFEKYFQVLSLPKNNGTKMHWRTSGKYNANDNDLIEGILPKEDDPMETYEHEIELSDFGGYTTFTDKLDIYSLDSGESTRLQRNQGYAVGKNIQIRANRILQSSNNHWFAGLDPNDTNIGSKLDTLANARAALSGITLEDFPKISTFMKRMDVDYFEDGKYLVIVSPEVKQQLFDTTKDDRKFTFLEMALMTKDKSKVFGNVIGDYLDFRFIENTGVGEINTDMTGSTGIHACFILGKYDGEYGAKLLKLEGYGEPQTIIKDVTAGDALTNPLNQVGSIGWKQMGWGGAVVYPQAVMVYECLANAVPAKLEAKDLPTYTGGYDKNGLPIDATEKSLMNGKNVSKVSDEKDSEFNPHSFISNCLVLFNSNGGSAVPAIMVAPGDKAVAPTAPTKSGYTFDKWYTDSACTRPFVWTTTKVTENMVLYAKWTQSTTTPSQQQ